MTISWCFCAPFYDFGFMILKGFLGPRVGWPSELQLLLLSCSVCVIGSFCRILFGSLSGPSGRKWIFPCPSSDIRYLRSKQLCFALKWVVYVVLRALLHLWGRPLTGSELRWEYSTTSTIHAFTDLRVISLFFSPSAFGLDIFLHHKFLTCSLIE